MNECKCNVTFLIFTMFLASPYWFRFIENLGLERLLIKESPTTTNTLSSSPIGSWYFESIHSIVENRRKLNGE